MKRHEYDYWRPGHFGAGPAPKSRRTRLKRCPYCGDVHDRKKISCEELHQVRAAERAAGWDPNP
jgi:hypothetical protein